MRPRMNQPEAIKEIKETTSTKKELVPVESHPQASAPATYQHPRQSNLSIQRKVVVESILMFCKPR
jgi:hypothetical protein